MINDDTHERMDNLTEDEWLERANARMQKIDGEYMSSYWDHATNLTEYNQEKMVYRSTDKGNIN